MFPGFNVPTSQGPVIRRFILEPFTDQAAAVSSHKFATTANMPRSFRFRTKTTGVFGVQQSALQRTRAYIDSMQRETSISGLWALCFSRFLSLRMGRPSFSGWKDTYPTYPFSLNSHFFGPKEKITPNHISKNKKHQHFVKQTYCNFRTPHCSSIYILTLRRGFYNKIYLGRDLSG